MARVKKLDGCSKEARALRSKAAAAKAGPARAWLATPQRKSRRSNAEIVAANKAKAKAKKPVKKLPHVAEFSFDRETTLRILSLQMASQNIGRDTAPRDLVPMARRIEEFLTGAVHNVAGAGNGSFVGYAGMNADELAKEIAAQSFHDAEHAFD
jgi:hypothetical protein